MIFARVEIWPEGNPRASRQIGELFIANVGGTEEIGNYVVRLSRPAGFKNPRNGEGRVLAEGEVVAFRRNPPNPWELIRAALAAVTGKLSHG